MNPTPPETAAPSNADQRRKPMPALIPQPRGGALYAGGVPGNRGGAKPSVLRDLLRRDLEQLRPMLKRIARGKPPREGDAAPSMADRLKATEILARYGLGQAVELSTDHVQDRLHKTLSAIVRALPAELADPLIRELRAIWT